MGNSFKSVSFNDGALRLKILGYQWIKYEDFMNPEIHFIKDKKKIDQYLSSPSISNLRRYLAAYIYNVKENEWVKQNSPLEAMMPITDAERILYGKA